VISPRQQTTLHGATPTLEVPNNLSAPLVIIDAEGATAALRSSLEEIGFRVRICDRTDLIATCSHAGADALILDATSHEAMAFDLCVQIRAVLPPTHMAILALVPTDNSESIAKAHAAGASDFAFEITSAAVLAQRVQFLSQLPRLGRALHDAEARLSRMEAHVRQLTYFDAATGLPTLQWLTERLTLAIDIASTSHMQIAAIVVDVTCFERFSNTFGLAVGSELLTHIADRLQTYALQAAVHHSNRINETLGTMAARIGTHQFALVLPLSREFDWIGDLLHQLTETLNAPCNIAGYTLTVDTNIGIALYPDDATTADILLQSAGAALYAAKRGEGNIQFYSAKQQRNAVRRVSLESDLRGALEREELQLYFQPRIELASLTPIAAEALLRWKHPDRGWVSPTEFIPIAEDIGVIDELWQWVLHEACRRAASYAEKTPVRISVNVSGAQFRNNSIAEQVREALWCHSLDPRLLELEITEGVLIERPQLVHDTLNLIRDHGVQIALDDFGTGYSSLSYLRKLPLDFLKIDRSFIADLEDSGDGAAVAESILALARTLNLRAVAEGVETEAQLKFLSQRGCEECQGYFFAKPMPGDALERWLAEQATVAAQRNQPDELDLEEPSNLLKFLRKTGN